MGSQGCSHLTSTKASASFSKPKNKVTLKNYFKKLKPNPFNEASNSIEVDGDQPQTETNPLTLKPAFLKHILNPLRLQIPLGLFN